MEQAEKQARVDVEMVRREQVAREKREREEREQAEEKERQIREAAELEEAKRVAREARAEQRAKIEEFQRLIEKDPKDLRSAANALMEADEGATTKDCKAIPLRLFTRRKEVAWHWSGEVMELIGGGVNEDDDSWDA